MKILIAGEFSGRVRDSFIAIGHDAWSCDFGPSEREGPHIEGNYFNYLDEGWDLLIGHPDCTHTASSGARWFGNKEHEQDIAVQQFKELYNCDIPRICLEQPVGIISTRFMSPTQYIQPYEFGEPETKKTCLWLRNLPALKPTGYVLPLYHSVFYEPPGENRARNRSRTYWGIARAMAEQWGSSVDDTEWVAED